MEIAKILQKVNLCSNIFASGKKQNIKPMQFAYKVLNI